MKFFYKVDGEHFDTPCYYKDYTSALYYMMQYAQRLAHGNEALDYASERKFGWELVYVEKIYFEGEEE